MGDKPNAVGSISDALPEIVWTATPRCRINWFNRRWYQYTGLSQADVAKAAELERLWESSIHPEERVHALEQRKIAVRDRRPFTMELRLRRADGVYRWFKLHAAPTDRAGAQIRWAGVCTDIDEDHRRSRRLAFMAKAGEVLSESLDLQTTLLRLLEVIVPEFGDWAAIDLLDDQERLKTVAAIHADPRKAAIVRRLCDAYNHAPHFERLVIEALRIRRPWIVRKIAPDLLEEAAAPGMLRVIRDLRPRSTVTVPLRTRDRTLGSLVAYWAETQRQYDESDIPLFEELAKRAATAIDHARLFQREREVAKEFQRAALPMSLPQIPGIRFDGIYVAGSSGAQIGGDWYDALQLSDGRIVISIGDVAGTGLTAAVIMSSMRQVIRGVAQVYAGPIAMLDAADRTLKAEYPDTFVTAFVGVLDRVARTLTYAIAGHPRPFLRNAAGEVKALEGSGLPLGLRIRGETTEHVVEIEENAFLVFYTDGLTESQRDIVSDEQRLAAAIRRRKIVVNANPAKALYDVMVKDCIDDVVILTMHLGAATGNGSAAALGEQMRRWSFDSADAETASRARHEFVRALEEGRACSEDLYAAELVFGELLGNVVRYAPGKIEMMLDWSAQAPVLHVLDRGPGFVFAPRLPTDLLSERGRGLFIVWSLSEDLNVTKRFDGGSHARAVLAIRRQHTANSAGHPAMV
jgi:PAS domain S-box-containing protein